MPTFSSRLSHFSRRHAPLAGLVLATLTACRPAATRATGSETAEALPAPYVIVDGQSQVVPAFADTSQWIRERLWVETEFDSDYDGRKDRVHVHVTRPGPTAAGLKVPVVYETSPYYAGTLGNSADVFWPVKQELGDEPPARKLGTGVPFNPNRTSISNSQLRNWVPRGFAVVHSESPGTGLSQGCPTIGGMNESLAPKAVIDWLNGRAKGYTAAEGGQEVVATWTTGKVGMTGTSFNGTLPVAAATTGVKGLEAIIPVAPNNSYYRYYRSNGLVRSPGGYLGEDVDVLYDYVHSGNPATRATCNARVRDEIMRNLDRRSGDLSTWWIERDYIEQAKGIRAAMLTAHGLNDWNVMPSHTVLMAEAVRKNGTPVQMYFHQGGHGGEPPLSMMNRWFTRYLLGVQNGVENDPRSYVVREGVNRQNPTAYPDFPHPSAREVTLFPGKGGAQVGTLTVARAAGQGSETLTDDVSKSGTSLVLAAASPNRLLYATPELTAPLHVSGTARITLRVASSKPAANLSVWLVMLPWPATAATNNEAGIITRGWADPQNARSLRSSTPLVPGQPVTMTFDLEPDDQIIPAGKRIGVMIFSSDRDFTLWPSPGTVLTVDLDATSITLPVVGGRDAFNQAVR
jgi:X-Pro dipeptidyl-peptidase